MKIKNAWCTGNNGFPVDDEEVKRYIAVRPSERQLAFNEMKYYNFIHFGVNTFTNREWGDGKESESVFDPSELDTDQWCRVLKDTGSKGIILTAKHHDGFCLFDSEFTDHTVMKSPFGKDIVRLLSESCKKYSLKLGLYLSPWDRHEKTYGSEEYNDFFVGQLTELCTNYGGLFCLWFDGACGEGANGKKQIYDWERYYKVIRKYQPEAVIAVCGPDVRWIGNEGGKVRKSEWSVIPWSEKTMDEIADNSQKEESNSPDSFDQRSNDLGSRDKLVGKSDLRWSPAEADVSITYGWFWHDNSYYKRNLKGASRSPKELANIYFNTVGANASMLLNVPPDKRGLISEREIAVLKKFTEIIKSTFAEEIPYSLKLLTADGEESSPDSEGFMLKDNEIGMRLAPTGKFRTIYIEEDIKYSQRIEEFKVYANGKRIYKGTVIGSGKIIRLPRGIKGGKIDVIITQSRGNPAIKSIRLYK